MASEFPAPTSSPYLAPTYSPPPPVERAKLTGGQWVALVLAVLLTVLGIGGAGWLALHPQRVTDQLAVWQYTPTVAVEGYVDRAGLTDEGRFLLYASHPRIAPRDEFNSVCSSNQEDVGVLGCYLPNTQRIYLFDVTDDRLAGLEEVVASHELLHAAWDRMSAAERDALAPLLEAEAAKRVDDADFAATMAFYADAEPGQRLNELHSIIGTEFTNVSAELEAHYAAYFTDRASLVALHEQSIRVFKEQAAAVQGLTDQLNQLAASIDAEYAAYNAGYDQLNAEIDDFNARANSGAFTTQAQFNAERSALIDRQTALDASYTAMQARVADYDALADQLTALNATTEELNLAINIAPHPASGANN